MPDGVLMTLLMPRGVQMRESIFQFKKIIPFIFIVCVIVFGFFIFKSRYDERFYFAMLSVVLALFFFGSRWSLWGALLSVYALKHDSYAETKLTGGHSSSK